MKRLLFILMVLASLPGFSQTSIRSHTFRFDVPETLNPSITRSPYEGGAVNVTNKVFSTKDGNVSISFVKGSSPIGAEIITDNAAGDRIPYLTFNTTVQMIVSVQNEQTTKIVQFKSPAYDPIGGVSLRSTVPETDVLANGFRRDSETIEDGTRYYRWRGSVNSLVFMNVGQSPSFHQFTVNYELPRDILHIKNISPADHSSQKSLNEFVLTFDTDEIVGQMRVAANAVYTLTDSHGFSYSLNATANGNQVTLRPTEALTAAGDYTLTVAAGSFSDGDGFCNEACSYTFTLLEKLDIFTPTEVSPEGTVTSLVNGSIIQTYPGIIGKVDATKNVILTDQTGKVVRQGHAEKNGDNSIKIVFSNTAELTTAGIYTLLIPEGTVYDADDHYYNPETTYTYNIGDLPSEELKLKARVLLGMMGLGYPTANSAARKALEGLSEASTATEYNAAIANYLASTEIEMPVSGTNYKISAVTADNSVYYLKYSDGVVSLSDKETDAVMLNVTENNGKFSFKTSDDKYLLLPGSPGASVSSSPSSANDLTLAKFVFASADSESILGLFSISDAGNFAIANANSKAFDSPSVAQSFDGTKTGAYRITKANDHEIPGDFKYDLLTKYRVYVRDSKPANEAVKDTVLNHFAFYTYDTEIGIDPTKIVKILNYNTLKEVASGHFETVIDKTLPGASVAELKLDVPIKANSLSAAMYAIAIPAGAIGDKTYKDYLGGKLVAKSDCHVIPDYMVYMTVDNSDEIKEYPSTEVYNKARKALEKTGIGYPRSGSRVRLDLQQLVISGEGSDNVFLAAINSFYKDTDIERPADNKYYVVAAVSANGTKVYLKKDGTLTTSSSEAGAFKATSQQNNAISLSTVDGKYLTVLSANGSLSDAYNFVENNLQLDRFPVTVGDVEKTFGLMTIVGVKGSTTQMSQVNASTKTITTNGNTAVFTNNLTSAFQLTETSKPDDPVQTVRYTLSPADDAQITTSRFEVNLSFDFTSDIKLNDESKIVLLGNSQSYVASNVTEKQKGKQFAIVFDGLTNGDYTLTIDEGAFIYISMGQTKNVQAIGARYHVTLKQYPSERILNKARQLLAMKGVGCPTADSPARLALQELVNAAEGGDDIFENAIQNYCNENLIEKPANGKYYRILALGKKNESTNTSRSAYLKSNGSALDLVSSATQNGIFKAKVNEYGTISLLDISGKFMKVPAPENSLTDNYDASVNDLVLSRLSVNGQSAEETFGLISIGNGGKVAVADVSSSPTVKTPSAQSVFTMTETSGFKFEEVSESSVLTPNVDYQLTPGANTTVTTLEKVVITFQTEGKVTLKDESLINLTDALNGKVFKPGYIKAVEGESNTFEIGFVNTEARIYDLSIGSGAFVVALWGNEVSVNGITARQIRATESVEMKTDFETLYNLRWVEKPADGQSVNDVDLNTFTLKADAPIFLADPALPVLIKNGLGTEKARGYLEATDDDTMVRLVLNEEIYPGSLHTTQRNKIYTIEIKQSTFGDVNFFQYQTNPDLVSRADCHVNSKITYSVEVSMSTTTDINKIDIADENMPVYDMYGNKVKKELESGKVYIRKGSKFIIRKNH